MGRMEIDKAAALSFAFIINIQIETVATEPFPEGVAGVAFCAKLVEQPILRPFTLCPPFDQFLQGRMDRHFSGRSFCLALLDVEDTIVNLFDPQGEDFVHTHAGQ